MIGCSTRDGFPFESSAHPGVAPSASQLLNPKHVKLSGSVHEKLGVNSVEKIQVKISPLPAFTVAEIESDVVFVSMTVTESAEAFFAEHIKVKIRTTKISEFLSILCLTSPRELRV